MIETTLTTILWLAVGFFFGWLAAKARTLSDYNAMYSHLTADIISRMTRAMRSLCMEQADIDQVIHRMGCKVMPAAVPPPPAPQVKPERDFDKEPYTMDEVVRRLSPHGDRAGEWYCTSRQRKMAWRIDMVDAEGLIVRKLVHDMREHTISKAPEIYKPETVEQLAKKIIDYNFRFLADFDFKEWE
jgi:hypothetical protein